MRHKQVVAGAAVAALGFLAAACGATNGPGASSGGHVVQSPVQAAVASPSPTPAAAPPAIIAGQVGVLGQAGPDMGLVPGRADALQQGQLLQQGDMTAVAAQATTSASDPAGLICG